MAETGSYTSPELKSVINITAIPFNHFVVIVVINTTIVVFLNINVSVVII